MSESHSNARVQDDVSPNTLVNPASIPGRLLEIAEKHQVCYEVWPERSVAQGRKIQIGFELQFCGTNSQQTKIGQVKVRHTGLFVLVGLLLLILTQSLKAQEFTYRVQQDRLIGHRDGELIISNEGVEYRAKREKESRAWAYTDIRLLEILSPRRVRIWTYKDRKLLLRREQSLTFKIVEGQIDQNVSDFLRERIAHPFVTSFAEEDQNALAQIPVKHSHRFGGCEGVLRIYSDRLVYESETGHDSRSWRWTDIRSVGRPDIYRFDVETFEPQLGASSRSFNFTLKEQMADKTYDLIWSRVFRPTPLIRAETRVSGQ